MKLVIKSDSLDTIEITVPDGEDPVKAVVKAIEEEANLDPRYFEMPSYVYVQGDWDAVINLDSVISIAVEVKSVYVRQERK